MEFCRSGVLGPLHRGLSANEVERLLGRPNSSSSTFEASDREKYRYGSVFLTLTAPSSQEPNGETLKVTAIDLSLHHLPLRLPGLDVLQEEERTIDDKLYQAYRTDGGGGSKIVALDGTVREIHG